MHPESPGETTSGVGGIAAPELDVVETFDVEAVGLGIGPDEFGESDQLELLAGVGQSFFAHFLLLLLLLVVVVVVLFCCFGCEEAALNRRERKAGQAAGDVTWGSSIGQSAKFCILFVSVLF